MIHHLPLGHSVSRYPSSALWSGTRVLISQSRCISQQARHRGLYKRGGDGSAFMKSLVREDLEKKT